MNKRQKKKQKKIKNKKIVKRYPWLLPRNVWDDKLPDDYDYSYSLADCLPDGWRKAFFTEMHEEIRRELIRCNYLKDFRVMQIKEKYARLCYYEAGHPIECNISDIIRKYEHISQYVCIDCGKIDVPVVDDGWLTPICEKCYNKRQISQKKLYEHIGIKYGRTRLYEELPKSDDYILKDYYEVSVYSNGKWEDIKIDISDTVRKLRNKC